MSTPTTRSFGAADGGGRTSHEIADFVSAVRAQLDDLSVDEVTELTGGLEADLTDALAAEAGSTPSQLHGDPVEYASELRAAAGLPPRAGGTRRGQRPGMAEEIIGSAQTAIQAAIQDLDRQPWWPGVRDFLIVVRPAWWVLRAWIVVEAFFLVVGVGNSVVRGGFGGLVLLIAAIVLSVQLARHSLVPQAWQPMLVVVWNVIAVLLLLPVMFASAGSGQYDNSYSDGDRARPESGLYLGDQPVTNVFPYDAAGRPLVGVQLFDQDGRSLEVPEDNRTVYPDDGGEYELVPGSPPGSAPRWNAFPLQRRLHDPENGELGPIEPAPLPLNGVPPLPASLTPTPAGSSAPDVTETPIPSPSTSQSAKPKPRPTVTK
jgi:hypothetical protein